MALCTFLLHLISNSGEHFASINKIILEVALQHFDPTYMTVLLHHDIDYSELAGLVSAYRVLMYAREVRENTLYARGGGGGGVCEARR